MRTFRQRTIRVTSAVQIALVVACSFVAGPTSVARASDTPDPTSVTIPGSLESEATSDACGDWDPACAAAHLVYDADDAVWQRTFALPAGSFEYKAAIDDAWTENYGLHAQAGGANIPLALSDAANVKFYYDHETHWVTDDHNSIIVTAPGSYQSEIGAPGDWDPSNLRSWLEDPDGDGTYTKTFAAIPPGSYECKIAIHESWDENYGDGGVPNGANIAFTVSGDCSAVEFRYDSVSHVLTIGGADAGGPQPASVTIAGSLESEATGDACGDWTPPCAAAHLAYDADDTVWQRAFPIPAGSWEYKGALDDSWDVNYGLHAQQGGANIPLNLPSAASVKFYYDNATHWVTDDHSSLIVTAPGSYQSEIGAPGDWDPSNLRSWLEDPDGDGLYTKTFHDIPAGSYECKAAINESWDLNYGDGGVQNGANISFTVAQSCADVTFSFDSVSHVLTVGTTGGPKGDLSKARAHWVSRDTIAWNPAGFAADGQYALHYAADGSLVLGTDGVTGGTAIPLAYDPAGLPDAIKQLYPHLASFRAFKVPADRLAEVPAALQGQTAVSAKTGSGTPTDATSIQIPGVLDDLYTYNGKLGVQPVGLSPSFAVWAPTARSVKLRVFADANPATTYSTVAMQRNATTGVWSATGSPLWWNRYYQYEVDVWVPSVHGFQTNVVTDPYSVGLSKNGERSQILDLRSPLLKPLLWDLMPKPQLDAPEDIVLYELHVRDFSANDPSVPANLRGTFKAFSIPGSYGMKHLAALARAGLTHVHLLPAFDIRSVNEDKSTWQTPAGNLAGYPPDSEQQQAAVDAVRDTDAFNWGYDPVHYMVPDGSYATNPDGAARVLEFRQMVKGLNDAGLRTVMDVVFNHTSAAGQNAGSVLDRIVPGYYYRLDLDGNILNGSCCPDTASEHNMMEKLLVDSCVLWATAYKVDGFRFDLMSFHMKRNLLKLRSALDALTLARDGVDGTKIYLYGEGWNFGETGDNARGVNATQANMAGTGVGTFNDRIRDGVRGGGPFGGLQEQGFLTGLSYDPNGITPGSAGEQDARLLLFTDWLKVSLAGNLAGYSFVDRNGATITGSQLDYNGQRAGYTADPQEDVNYIEAHDNETLFDAIQYKAAPADTIGDRTRTQALGLDLLVYGQGVPFVHAGSDMLRSKSLDRNSYNSGDWFNKLDFTYQTNNWGVGLPPASENMANWPIMRPLLANPALRPSPANISDAVFGFREALAVRKSSRLFRLRTAADVSARLHYFNNGPSQLRGLVVMQLTDGDGAYDRANKQVVVLVNANDAAQTFADAAFSGHALSLHPVLAASHDPVVRTSSFASGTGSFVVPARTAAVFVEKRTADERIVLLEGDVAALAASGALNAGQANGLRAKLEAARASLARGNTNAAAAQLQAFVLQVQAFMLTGQLSLAQGQPLVAEAQAIVALIRS